MKQVILHKSFQKAYVKRIKPQAKLSRQFDERLLYFKTEERTDLLDDHALSGNMIGFRAFSVTGDIRVIYREAEGVYTLVDIGTHAQVYK